MSNNVVVLIGDIVASRDVDNRIKLQRRLSEAIHKVNAVSNSLLSPYTITLGDECQAVLRNAEGLFRDIFTVRKKIHPSKIRFSIGIGGVATSINPDMAIGMDGEAFYAAREGLDELKKSKGMLSVRGLKCRSAALLEETLSLVSWLSSDWEKNRLGVLLGFIQEQPAAQIAKELGISRQAVYQNRDAGNLETVAEVFRACTTLINAETTHNAD